MFFEQHFFLHHANMLLEFNYLYMSGIKCVNKEDLAHLRSTSGPQCKMRLTSHVWTNT